MKVKDVVLHLYEQLPLNSDKFTQSVAITDYTVSSGVATVTTDTDHGLDSGDTCTIIDLYFANNITSMERVDDTVTVVTETEHDLTEGFQEEITISGSSETDFNGTFDIESVVDSNTFTFKTTNTGSLTDSGSPILHEYTGYNYQLINGYETVVSVPTTNSFTYDVGSLPDMNITDTGEVYTGFRVTGAVDFESAYDMYTKRDDGEYWAFVVSDANTASKDRKTNSDGIYVINNVSGYRQELNQNFFVYVFATVSGDMDAYLVKDDMQDIMVSLVKSICGLHLDSGLCVGDYYATVFDSHVTQFYNKAIYVHSFAFQNTAQISSDDVYQSSDDVSLRKINFELYPLAKSLESDAAIDSLNGEINLPKGE